MKESIFTIEENRVIAPSTRLLRLQGDTSAITVPGQFVDIHIDSSFLRRPFSVSDWDDTGVSVVYKQVGKGTGALARKEPGSQLSVLTGLGNGFDLSLAGARPLLLGGGSGVSPMLGLARRLVCEGREVTAILGFNTEAEVFYARELESLGCRVIVCTVDGSCGRKGFVTDAITEEYTRFYACGPEPMLRAVYSRATLDGEFSLEARMGCGFGACMGCTIQTRSGYRRVCKDGPVFRKEELLWDD